MINIVIADKNIQSVKYIINAIFYKLGNINIRTFVATNEQEILDILAQNSIDLLLVNINISNYNILNLVKNSMRIENNIEIEKIIEKINLCNHNGITEVILSQLLNLGYNFKLKGTQYLLESILYIYKKNDINLLDNLEQNVYREIAIKNNKTTNNIKTNIIKATEFVYIHQKKEIIEKYFYINIKITPKMVISTILSKIK